MSGKNVKVKIKVQPVVVMEAEVARKIRQHARTSMKAEVCGVLIGSTDDDRTVIEACIAGINAAQGGAHVTFTQDTWEHIYKIKDQQYPDDKIVGWYHSHPGFGVFLSEHDLFIQENFFSSPQQVAWVYDPHTDEEGCFGWVGGKTEKLTGLRFGYSQSVEIDSSAAAEYDENGDSDVEMGAQIRRRADPEESREPAWIKWASRIMVGFSLLLLGFLAHDFLWFPISPTARAMQQRLVQYEDLLQQVQLQWQQCEPEIRACQARLQGARLAPLPSSGAPAAGAQTPQELSQPLPRGPQPKASATPGKGSNVKR